MRNAPLSHSPQIWTKALAIFRAKHFQSEVHLWIAAFFSLAVAYCLQFYWVRTTTLLMALESTWINIGPILLLGLIVRLIIRYFAIGRSILTQIIIHIFLAAIFSHCLYLLILIVDDLQLNWISEGFNISPFYASATKWQLFQGLIIYGGLQGLIYGWWLYEHLMSSQEKVALQNETSADKIELSDPSKASIFIKHDSEYKKIDAADLVHIEANGDYVLLHTRQGVYSSGKSLNVFATQLEELGFIRAHRSHLVNVKAIQSAEPTGDGRLSLHLSNGTTVTASRNGSRLFRQLTS